MELPGSALPAAVVAAETQAAIARAAGSPPPRLPPSRVPSPPPASAPAAAPGERYGREYFDRIFGARDPWDATSEYERTKAARTLSLLPPDRARRALEVGCAGGHFTAELARRVDRLLAVDLSERALAAAAERCRGLPDIQNVGFERLDVRAQPPAGPFDLIVVSEVLHYLPDRAELERVIGSLLERLEPGGHLLVAHALSIVDQPARTGFDWQCAFGGERIAATIAAAPGVCHRRGIRTPLYRVDLFRKQAAGELPAADLGEIHHLPLAARLSAAQALQVAWGAEARDAGGAWRHGITDEIPVLAYHRIAVGADPPLDEWCVHPEQLEAQLSHLEREGYTAISLAELRLALGSHRPLPERSLLLTFDDGYADFASTAAPLLIGHGFAATVFLVTDLVGGVAEWDRALGEPAPLMGWDEVRDLAARGFGFGSHGASHRKLSRLSLDEVRREGAASRDAMARQLGAAPLAICYPHGAGGGLVGHALAGCGFELGFLGGERLCRTGSVQSDPPMAVPRRTILHSDDLESFRRKLGEVADRARSGWREARSESRASSSPPPSPRDAVLVVELDAWDGGALDAARAPFLTSPAPLRRAGRLADAPPPAAAADAPARARWASLLDAQRAAGVAASWIDPPAVAGATALALAQLAEDLDARDRIHSSIQMPRLVVMRLPAPDEDADSSLVAADAAVARAVALLTRHHPRLATLVLPRPGSAAGAGVPLLAYGELARRPAVDQASLVAEVCALAGLRANTEPVAAAPAASCRLSVVIPTYEREEQLGVLLDSLERQSLFTSGPADFEVVVVVDGSSDGTLRSLAHRAAAWSERGVTLRFETQPNQGAAAARNRGVLAARGEVVLFLDDDLVVAPDVLEQHREFHATHPGLAHACLGLVDWSGDDSPLGRYLWRSDEYLDWKRVYERDPDDVGAEAFWTGQLSLKRHFLLAHGLFDEAFGRQAGEDLDLGRRLVPAGLALHFRAGSVTRLQERFALESLMRRQRLKGWSAGTLSSHGLGAQWTGSAMEAAGIYSERALNEIVEAVAACEAARAGGDGLDGEALERIYATALRYAALVGAADRAGTLHGNGGGAVVSLLHWTALVEDSVRNLWSSKDREIGEAYKIWSDKDEQLRRAQLLFEQMDAERGRVEDALRDVRARLELALRLRGAPGQTGQRERGAHRDLKLRLEASERQRREAEQRLAEATRIWRDRDALLAAADRMWREKDRQLAEAEAVWRDKDRQLEEAAAERAWMLNGAGLLPPEIAARWREPERERETSRRGWREKDRQLAEAERSWREKDRQLVNAERMWRAKDDEIEAIGARLRALEGSRSWRWTAPLRRLGASLQPPPPSPGARAAASEPPPTAPPVRVAEPVPICTIVCNNYLAYARVLVESYLEHHPGARAFVCVVERTPATVPGGGVPWTQVAVEELAIPGFRNMAFRYDVLELCTAVKPWLLAFLRDRHGLDRVFYLDPDILVLDRLHGLESALAEHDAVLTPHLCEPAEAGWRPGERGLLRAGTFNLGFIGLRLNDRTAPFLAWWQERLRHYCSRRHRRRPLRRPGVDEPGAVVPGLAAGQPRPGLQRRLVEPVAAADRRSGRPLLGGWTAARLLPLQRPRCPAAGAALQAPRGPDARQAPGRAAPRRALSRPRRSGGRRRAARRELRLRPLRRHRHRDPAAHPPHAAPPRPAGPALARPLRHPRPRQLPRLAGGVAGAPRRRAQPRRAGALGGSAGRRDRLSPRLRRGPAALRRLAHHLRRGGAGGLRAGAARRHQRARQTAEGLAVRGAERVRRALRRGRRAAEPAARRARLHAARQVARLAQPARRSREAAAAVDQPGNAHPPGASRLAAQLPRSIGGRPAGVRAVVLRAGRGRVRDASGAAGAGAALAAPQAAARRRAARANRRGRRPVVTYGRAANDPAPPPLVAKRTPAAGKALPPARRQWPRGVNLAGYFSADSGVAQVGRGAAAALAKSGLPFVKVPLDQDYSESVVARRVENPEGAPYPVTLLHANAGEIPTVVATLPLAAGRTGVRIGYWFWELAHFPLAYAKAAALVDEIWAPSRFCRAAFEASAPVPVRWVPPCVPAPARGRVSPQDARAALGLEPERFYFFFAFDARSVPERKNPLAAVEALRRVLARTERPRRDVGLLLKVQEAERQPELLAELRAAANGLPVTFYEGATDREAVEQMLAACDAVLSLHRSEGLGLLPIEAMYLDKPVVATAYGGVCDFLDEESGFPVRHRLVALDRDHGPYPAGAVWADPDLDHAAEMMVRVVGGGALVERLTRAARRRVEQLYGVEAAAGRYREALTAVFDRFEIGEPDGAESGPIVAGAMEPVVALAPRFRAPEPTP